MISGDFTHCTHLFDFYMEICDLHVAAHGEEYLAVHDEIAERLDSTMTYRELGVNQGATLALASLILPNKIRAYDINLKNFEPYRPLFTVFHRDYGGDFRAEEKSSLDPSTVEDVDVLYIDTVHTAEHLIKELHLHHSSVKKYIICHDTFAKPGMHMAIENFCMMNPEWRVAKYYQKNVGYTTLERIHENPTPNL